MIGCPRDRAGEGYLWERVASSPDVQFRIYRRVRLRYDELGHLPGMNGARGKRYDELSMGGNAQGTYRTPE